MKNLNNNRLKIFVIFGQLIFKSVWTSIYMGLEPECKLWNYQDQYARSSFFLLHFSKNVYLNFSTLDGLAWHVRSLAATNIISFSGSFGRMQWFIDYWLIDIPENEAIVVI